MTVYKWSQTAASNATADGSINWAEGMAPSAVNDSARATMAAVAKYRDDMAGSITTGGTSTAYTVTSNQVFDTLAHLNNQIIAFVPHTTNGDTVTLNVDSLGAKPLRQAPSVEIPAGVLIAGTPYAATYNNSNSEFLLRGFFGNPYNVPLAVALPYFGTTAPNSSFVFPYGQAISRTTYSTLFSAFSTTYGTGDGSTTFNLPDLRGRAPVGRDNMGGSAASRITSGGSGITGTTLGATGGEEAHNLTLSELAAHNHVVNINDPGHSHVHEFSLSSGSGTVGNGASFVLGSKFTDTAVTGITASSNNTGSGSAHNNVQPIIVANYIMRVI